MVRNPMLFVLASVCLLAGGCTKDSPNEPAADSRNHFATHLPTDTLAYVRVSDPKQIKDSFVRSEYVTDAAEVQAEIDKWFDSLVGEMSADANPFGVSGATLLQLFNDVDALHVALIAQSGEPLPILFLEMKSTSSIEAFFQEAGDRFQERVVDGTTVKETSVLGPRDKLAVFHLDETTLVATTDSMLETILNMQGADDATLAESAGFQQAYGDFGHEGDLFAYLSVDQIRKQMPEAPLDTMGSVAASMDAEGQLAIRAYAAEGKTFPDFLVRESRAKAFAKRIPADAALVLDWSFDGGKETRDKFFDWVGTELGTGSLSAGEFLPPQFARAAEELSQNRDRIESEVFVMFQDMWVAAIPVKSEMAVFIAPDASGRWGGAMFFDIEDRQQAETLMRKIVEQGERHNLPWQTLDHEGLTIRYLDIGQAIESNDGQVPQELRSQVQLKVGYAMSDELLIAGTVEAIKFAHKPSGKTFADEISYDGVDEKNAMLMTVRPGKVVHHKFGIPEVDDAMAKLAGQLPEDSSYSITATMEEEQITVRSNIPIPSLVGWLGMESLGKGPAGLPLSKGGGLATPLSSAREDARLAVRKNNLKQIGYAMWNYADTFKDFPPHRGLRPEQFDAEGKSKLSWRVHILPFIEHGFLYDQFHLDEPWDSPHNIKLLDLMPEIYRTTDSDTETTFLRPVGHGAAFDGKAGPGPARIHDGTANTIMVFEAGRDKAVPWTKPEDAIFDPENPWQILGELESDLLLVLFYDGSVHSIPPSIETSTLRALITAAGNEPLDSEDF